MSEDVGMNEDALAARFPPGAVATYVADMASELARLAAGAGLGAARDALEQAAVAARETQRPAP